MESMRRTGSIHAGAIAWAMAPLCSCADPDTTPPELEEARFADATTIALRFSEPLAAVADVDPSSHFRLGTAVVIDDLEGGELTVYYDLAHHFR